MTEKSKIKVVQETLKIKDEELTFVDIIKRFDDIVKHFEDSSVSFSNLEKYNHFINMLWKRKYYDEALTAVEKAQERYPGDRNLLEKQGEILIDAGRIDEAHYIFEELLDIFPERYQYLEYLGKIYLIKGCYDQVIDALLKVLECSIGDPYYTMIRFDIMEDIAQAYYQQDDFNSALEYLQEILLIHPRTSKWRLYFNVLKKLGLEEETKQAKIAYEDIKKAKRYFSRASKYALQNKLETSLRNIKKAIDANPYEPHYYYAYGSTLEKLPENEYEFQFEEATQYYKKAVELYPNNFFYLLGLTGNLAHIGELEEAFELAIEGAAQSPLLFIPLLRELSHTLNKDSQFIAALRKYIDEDKKGRFIELRTELAILLKERNDPENIEWFNKALELYVEELEFNPYNWRGYWDCGNCYLDLGDMETAKAFLAKAMSILGSFSVDVGEKLMEIYYSEDDFSKAKILLERLIVSRPSDYEYYGKLGMCLLYEKEYEKAFEAFNRSLSINRYNPEYLYGAAVSAARLANTKDAIDIIKDLLEMNPQFLDIIEREESFLDVKETNEFLQMLRLHKTGALKPPKPMIKMKKFILPDQAGDVTKTNSKSEESLGSEKITNQETNA